MNANLTDVELKEQIEQEFLNDDRLSAHNIQVEVDNRTVTLRGSVNSFRESLLAVDIVGQYPEVGDIVNLLEFLTARGKFVPIDLAKVATAVSTKGMFTSELAGRERLIFPDWKLKTFDGVPFALVDSQGDRVKNVIMLHGPKGALTA